MVWCWTVKPSSVPGSDPEGFGASYGMDGDKGQMGPQQVSEGEGGE